MENNATATVREQLCRYCRRLYDRRLVSGNAGNMAARAGEKILLTASGCCLGDMTPDRVTTLDGDGRVLAGPPPTREARMHLEILAVRPDVNVVCHIHGAHIIAASIMARPGRDTLPPLTPAFAALAWPLAMLPFQVPGTRALAESAAREFSGKRRALLLRNHGLLTVGSSFREAVTLAEEVDEAARVFVLTGGRGDTIPEEDIPRIR